MRTVQIDQINDIKITIDRDVPEHSQRRPFYKELKQLNYCETL